MNREIEIVISRYNEDLEWLNDDFFSSYNFPIICYNKGSNNDFNIKNEHKIIDIKNVGRESHTYLYHIINNYDNLSDVTIFFPGSCDMTIKNYRAKIVFKETIKHKNTVFIGQRLFSVRNTFYDYLIDDYVSSHAKNTINGEKLELAEFRPFGVWYDNYFKDVFAQYVTWSGVISVSKKHILQHPKEYYENLIKQLENSSNPEVGHYFERSWSAVFHPLKDCIFISKYTHKDLYNS